MSQSSPLVPFVFVCGIFAVFPLIWLFICLLTSLGGWRGLAKRYATKQQLRGDNFSMNSGSLGRKTRYTGMLNITVAAEGVALHTFILWRPWHKPLFIPWEDIHQLEYGQDRSRESSTFVVQPLGMPAITRVQLYGAPVKESLQKHAPA